MNENLSYLLHRIIHKALRQDSILVLDYSLLAVWNGSLVLLEYFS